MKKEKDVVIGSSSLAKKSKLYKVKKDDEYVSIVRSWVTQNTTTTCFLQRRRKRKD